MGIIFVAIILLIITVFASEFISRKDLEQKREQIGEKYNGTKDN